MSEVYLEVLFISVLIFPFVMYFKMIWSSFTYGIGQRKIAKQNILYVIAHPDDEAM